MAQQQDESTSTTTNDNANNQQQQQQDINQVELVTYMCGGNLFEVPKRYQVKGVLGQGAYGVVVSARDTDTDTDVAIKKIFNIFEHDKEYQKRILREGEKKSEKLTPIILHSSHRTTVKIMRHFRDHENIVNLVDLIPPKSFDEFRDVYIVMELMDSNLRQMIRSPQQLSDQNVQYFLYQMLRGLKYVHSAGVLHRDIKPSNILLNADMDVKLCDFGLSRGVDFETDPTMSTTYVATRWYRAPELLLMWDQASKALDVWSIGCILAELLEPLPRKKVLFPGKHYLNQLELILNVCGTPPEDEIKGCVKAKKYMKSLPKKPKQHFKDMYPHANPLAVDLLEKMLSFDPTKRITVEECLEHAYLETMHDPEDEPTCPTFDFKFNNDIEISEIKQMMYDEIMDFQLKEHGTYSQGVLNTNEVVHLDDNH